MATNRNLHQKGARIRVLQGTHKGKIGTILKVNPLRHTVTFKNGDVGYVQRSFCFFMNPEDSSPRSPQDGTPQPSTTRLLSTTTNPDTLPQTPEVSMTDRSGSFTFDGSTVESRHGSEVTSQVLMDLLANLIALMHLDDERVEEWTNLLRDRVNHFCPNPN
jgi:hypothetical protein